MSTRLPTVRVAVSVAGASPGFAPALERAHVVDLIRTRTALAVAHARHHEEADEVALVAAHLRQHAVVVVDAVLRRDRRVVPAVVHQDLAAARLELAEIGIDGVDERRSSRPRTSRRGRCRTSSSPSSDPDTRAGTSRPRRRSAASTWRRRRSTTPRCRSSCPGRSTLPSLNFDGAYIRFTLSSWTGVRQLSASSPLQASVAASNLHDGGVGQQAVLDAVLRVAGVEHRLIQHARALPAAAARRAWSAPARR